MEGIYIHSVYKRHDAKADKYTGFSVFEIWQDWKTNFESVLVKY